MNKSRRKIIFIFICILLIFLKKETNAVLIYDYSVEIDSSLIKNNDSLKSNYDKAVKALKKGKINESKIFLEKALDLLKKDKKSPLTYKIYSNYGILLYYLGDYKKALKYYDLAEEAIVNQLSSSSNRLIPVFVNKGNIFINLGELVKAENYLQKSISLLEKTGNTVWLSNIYNNLAIVNYEQKNYEKALNFYKKSLSIKEKNPNVNIVTTLNGIARCYKELNNFESANLFYLKSINRLLGSDKQDSYFLADCYLNYAVFLGESNKLDKMYPYLEKALSIYRNNFGGKHPDVALCYKNFGDYYKRKKKYNKALEYYQKAIIAELEKYNTTDVYNNPDISEIDPQLSILNILKSKSNVLYLLYRENKKTEILDFSLQTFDLCLNIIDKIRIAYQNEESKFELSKNEKDTYTQSIEIAIKLFQLTGNVNYKEKAFRYAERSKAASLMSSLNDENAKNFAGIPSKLQEQERHLKTEIATYREKVYEERKKLKRNNAKIKEWQNILFQLNEEYNKMVQHFEKEYPKYYALKYDTKTIDIKELQRKLEDNNVLLEYSLSDSALFTFLISKSKFEVQRQNINKDEININLESIRKCLKTNDFGKRSAQLYKEYTSSAHHLYNCLIKPNQEIINNKKLLIIPDGKMAYIPFGVLLKNKADTSRMNYRDLNYLIKNNAITYQNSATIGFSIESSGITISKSKKVLAFAPSYDHVSDSILYTERTARDKLYPIPGVKEEVNNISKIISGDIYVDEFATERNFKEKSYNYDVLHLAMHTIIDDENPMYSKLVFTQNQDTLQDGLLNTHEIYNMSFNARMVVLSACSTGDGRLQKGEGVMSLARGFFYAGCPSIIMTLWTVEDQSGSNLMSNFYRYLSQGFEKDDALRQAKLQYLKSADALKSHPYFWSGYVTMGNVEPLYDLDLRNKLIYGSGAIFILLLLLLYRKRRNKSLKQAA